MRRNVQIVCLASLASLVALAGCVSSRPFQSVLMQGAPTRVDVEKQATEPTLRLRARLHGNELWLSAHRSSHVVLSKKTHRNTFAIEGRGKPWLEPLELLLGLSVLFLPTAVFLAKMPKDPSPEYRIESEVNPMAMLPDPRYTIFGATFQGRVLDEDRFPEPARVSRYRVSVPASSQSLSYKVLAVDGREIAQGEVQVNTFGETLIESDASWERAVALQVKVNGQEMLVGIERTR